MVKKSLNHSLAPSWGHRKGATQWRSPGNYNLCLMNGIIETQVICSIFSYVLGFIQILVFCRNSPFGICNVYKLIMYEILDMIGKQEVLFGSITEIGDSLNVFYLHVGIFSNPRNREGVTYRGGSGNFTSIITAFWIWNQYCFPLLVKTFHY